MMTTVTTPVITLQSPFPSELLPLAWSWLNEFPERNFDDYGPCDLESFTEEMHNRLEIGERTWCVYKNNQPCGIIGYKPLTPRCGVLHGICFTQSAWGRETTATAVLQVIHMLFAEGCEKISATYFADNTKIHKFLRSLGAVIEGHLRGQTMRGGRLLDMRMVALFKEDLCH